MGGKTVTLKTPLTLKAFTSPPNKPYLLDAAGKNALFNLTMAGAAEIVLAVNSHDILVEENKKLREALERISAWPYNIQGDCVAAARHDAKIALEK